ncbi:hypothetical protein F5X99DRAFT_380060 [Biscogniauxia marginata]|nr:hypothetical protein F5X99DRAFT_380060 [Biscogniauxia marginata]
MFLFLFLVSALVYCFLFSPFFSHLSLSLSLLPGTQKSCTILSMYNNVRMYIPKKPFPKTRWQILFFPFPCRSTKDPRKGQNKQII